MIKFVAIAALLFISAGSPYDIKKTQSKKVKLPESFVLNTSSSCFEGHIIPAVTDTKIQLKYACEIICKKTTLCSGYALTGTVCGILSYNIPYPASGNTGTEIYTTISKPPTDLARNKAVTASVQSSSYASGASVTSDAVRCFTADTDCWCSSSLSPDIKISLGATYAIKKIIITPNPFRLSDLANAEIRVGSNGNQFDPLFGSISSTLANADKIVITGSKSGSYIVIRKPGLVAVLVYVCLCSVEAYNQ